MKTKFLSTAHTIRFPDDLYWKIKEKAKLERRPFNSQVVYLLELGYGLVVKRDEKLKEIEDDIKSA